MICYRNPPCADIVFSWGACEGGRALRKGVFLPSKHLLSTFYNTPPSKNPSKNLCLYSNPYKAPSKNPSGKHLLLENLLRTLLRSMRLHDPLAVCPISLVSQASLLSKKGSQRSEYSEAPQRGRKTGAARKWSKSVEKI